MVLYVSKFVLVSSSGMTALGNRSRKYSIEIEGWNFRTKSRPTRSVCSYL